MDAKPPVNSSPEPPASVPPTPAPSEPVPAPLPVPSSTVMPPQLPSASHPKLYRAVGLIVAVLIIAGAVVAVLHYGERKVAATKAAQPVTTTTATPMVTAASGSDNASLNADLNSVGVGLSKENQDQTAANGAINDQQQEISVPTD